MKFSVEDEIVRYPTGTQMPRADKDVYGVLFCYMHVGGGIYVWRSEDTPVEIEVGRRGGGATYYLKIAGVIVDHQYPSMREAARAGVLRFRDYANIPDRIGTWTDQRRVPRQ